MDKKRAPIFQNTDSSWSHITKTVNPLICTIEYGYSAKFLSKEEAEESYQKSQEAYYSQIKKLKESRNIPFTFSEYLDYWFIIATIKANIPPRIKFCWATSHFLYFSFLDSTI